MKLVIDMGTKYLNFAVFAESPQESLPVLLDFSVVDVEGKNQNLLTRAIQRAYDNLCTHYQLTEVIVIPKRSTVTTQLVHLEYLNDEKAMKKRLLEQVNLPGNPGEYITDWTVQEDNPEEDYRIVLVSSINVEEFKFISEAMKLVGERRYKIASPFSNLGIIFPKNNKPYLLIQSGHRSTEMYIIRDGVCLSYRHAKSFSGVQLSNVLMTTNSITIEDLYKFKNNATYYDLEPYNAISEVLTFIDNDVQQFIQDFNENESTPIAGYAVVGGIANLDFETFTSMLNLPVPRYYPRLPVANHKQIVDNQRNYIFECACVASEDDSATNFTAPKDKSIGQYIKLLTTFYTTLKVPLYLLVFAIVLSVGTNYVQNTLLDEKVYTEQTIVSNYQSEVDSLKATVETLQTTYTELLDDKQLAIVNYGETLSTLSQVIPSGTFITEIQDITTEYIPDSDAPLSTEPLTLEETSSSASGLVNGLDVNTLEMLVALEIKGYTNQSVKAYDYALLLKEVYKDAVVTSVKAEDDMYYYNIHVIIDK